MNSRKLRSTHSQRYHDFFARNGVVFSLPLVLDRSAQVKIQTPWVRIKQKLPMRLYCGICQSSTMTGRTWWDIHVYSHHQDLFTTYKSTDYLPYLSLIQNMINIQDNELLKQQWVCVSFLVEAEKWVGLGFHTLISTLCGIVRCLLNKPSLFPLSATKRLNDHLLEGQWVRSILEYAFECDRAVVSHTPVFTKLCSILDGPYPLIWIHKESGLDTESLLDSLAITSLEQFTHSSHSSQRFPFDLSIIYSGRPFMSEYLTHYPWLKANSSWFYQKALDILKHVFDSSIVDSCYHPLQSWEQVGQNYNQTMSTINLEIVQWFAHLIQHGYHHELLEQLIRSIDKIKHWTIIFKDSAKYYHQFIQSLEWILIAKWLIAWVVPNDTIMNSWWTATCLMSLDVGKNIIHEMMSWLQQSYPWSSLIYSNRDDGMENEWLIFHQDLYHKWYTDSINSHKHLLVTTKGTTVVGDPYDLRVHKECDIVVDFSSSKIYINGQKITSQELSSQITTVELFEQYVRNWFQKVSCSQLPRSSYSKYKSEMSSKILIPLKKLMKERFNIDFAIHVDGSNSSYTIDFDKQHISRFGFIKTIWW